MKIILGHKTNKKDVRGHDGGPDGWVGGDLGTQNSVLWLAKRVSLRMVVALSLTGEVPRRKIDIEA